MKYVIDIDEPEDCGCCPMNYDYISCQVYRGDEKLDPIKDWIAADLPDGVRPNRCPLSGCEVSE